MLVVLYRGDEIDGAAVAALSLLLLDNHGVQVVDFNDGEEGFADVTASAERVLVIGEYDWNVIQSLCSNAVHVYLYEHSYMRHYRTEEVDNYIKHVDDVIVGYGSGEDSCGAVDALLLFCEDQFCNPAKALIERLKNEAYIDFINDYSKGIRDTKMKEFIAGIDVIATSKSSPRPYIRVLGRILATGMNIDSLLDKGYDRLKEDKQQVKEEESSQDSSCASSPTSPQSQRGIFIKELPPFKRKSPPPPVFYDNNGRMPIKKRFCKKRPFRRPPHYNNHMNFPHRSPSPPPPNENYRVMEERNFYYYQQPRRNYRGHKRNGWSRSRAPHWKQVPTRCYYRYPMHGSSHVKNASSSF